MRDLPPETIKLIERSERTRANAIAGADKLRLAAADPDRLHEKQALTSAARVLEEQAAAFSEIVADLRWAPRYDV